MDGSFEVQVFQVPFRMSETMVNVGFALKIDGMIIFISNGNFAVDGTGSASLPANLNAEGDMETTEGLTLKSSDCRFRFNVQLHRTKKHSPGFYHNAQVQMADDFFAPEGICGEKKLQHTGCER